MKTFVPFLSLILSAFFFPSAAKSQFQVYPDSSNIFRMSEIVVSATRTRTPSIEVGSSVSVIDSLDIARANGTGILGLLREEYGLSLSRSGGPGQLTQVYMRGADPGNVLVEIDGVRMNMPDDPGNSYDLSALSLDNLKRIEILRGPQGTPYGSDAMAGVINVITNKGSGKPDYFLNLEGGSLNTYKALLGSSGSYGRLNYSITLSKTHSNGISAADQSFGNTERDGYQDYNASSHLGWKLSDNASLSLYATFDGGKMGLDQHGGQFGDDPTYVYNHQQGAYRAEADIASLPGWQQELSISFMRNLRTYSYDSTLYNPASSASSYQGNSFQLGWQNNFRIVPKNLITLGLEGSRETSKSTYLYLSSVYGNYASDVPLKGLNVYSLYLQDQVKTPRDLFTTIGARYDDYGKIGSAATYRITEAYLIESTGTKLKADIGTGFKAPSLFDLYDPNYGNPNLKSEKSLGWEAGFEQYFLGSTLHFGATYFNNRFTDMFGYDSNFVTINIDKAQTDGFEFHISGDISEFFSFNAGYTYTVAVDKSPGAADENMQLIRRPKNSGSLDLNYDFLHGSNVNLNVVYVGRRYDDDFSYYPAKRVELAAYTLVGASASYRFTRYLKLYGRIENLFNEKHEDVYGYGTVGRAGYIGIDLNIE